MYTIYGYGDCNVNTDGTPRKTKSEYPYNYDPITQFMNNSAKANNTIYTDRLLHWDYEKHNKLCRKHFGDEAQYWSGREPLKIQAFLRDWCNDQTLILTLIEEHCNQSNGYPTWRLDFNQSSLTNPTE